MKRILPFLLIVSLIVLGGCASKRLAKRGAKFEQAGMYEMAADMFYQSVVASSRNVDAAVGLRRTGQRVLDDKAMDVNRAYLESDDKRTVYSFIDARDYRQKIAETGVNLNLSHMAQAHYEEAKPRYLETLYHEARILLDEEKFRESEAKFAEIKRIEPDYQGIDEYMRVSQSEPVYREGLNFLSSGQYRRAYHNFNRILVNHGDYKDCKDLRDEALSKAMITISIAEFENRTRNQDIGMLVESKVASALNKLENPFVRIVDTRNIDVFIDHQVQGSTIGSDIRVGQLMAARAILNGTIARFHYSTGRPNVTERRGYLKETVTVKGKGDGEDVRETRYHKVTYKEVTQTSSVTITFQYQLSSIETGEVLVSDALSLKQADEIHYGDFGGEVSRLVPGYWEYIDKDSPKDRIDDNMMSIRSFRSMFSANKKIKSVDVLQEELLNDVAQRLASKVDQFNPEQ